MRLHWIKVFWLCVFTRDTWDVLMDLYGNYVIGVLLLARFGEHGWTWCRATCEAAKAALFVVEGKFWWVICMWGSHITWISMHARMPIVSQLLRRRRYVLGSSKLWSRVRSCMYTEFLLTLTQQDTRFIVCYYCTEYMQEWTYQKRRSVWSSTTITTWGSFTVYYWILYDSFGALCVCEARCLAELSDQLADQLCVFLMWQDAQSEELWESVDGIAVIYGKDEVMYSKSTTFQVSQLAVAAVWRSPCRMDSPPWCALTLQCWPLRC